jgi:hypothetical protein
MYDSLLFRLLFNNKIKIFTLNLFLFFLVIPPYLEIKVCPVLLNDCLYSFVAFKGLNHCTDIITHLRYFNIYTLNGKYSGVLFLIR